ncbi:MAG: sensor domain-containing diguanylate cyclase [Pseudomonadota bacterium]
MTQILHTWQTLVIVLLIGLAGASVHVRIRKRTAARPGVGSCTELTTLRWSLVGLLTTAVAVVAAPLLRHEGIDPALATATRLLAFSLLFPQIVQRVRAFTRIGIPQWRAVCAFLYGVSVLLALNAAALTLQDRPGQETAAQSVTAVAYILAVLASALALWRFISTPRQRWILVQLAALPLLLIGADWLTQSRDLTVFGQPLLSWAILVSALSLATLRTRELLIRPLPRSALIDEVQDALLVADSRGKIADFNRAFAELVDDPKLIGRSCVGFLPDTLVESLREEGPLCLVLPWTLREEELWFETHLTPLFADNHHAGTLVTLRDVTRRRRAEAALEAANRKLEQLANTDSLTRLANRRAFTERLQQEMDRHARSGLTLGLILVDLDHFKRINDEHGHSAGDAVLVAVADCLRSVCRESDFCARLGGEELAIIAVDGTSVGPTRLAERLRRAIDALRVATDEDTAPLHVTASFGVAVQSALTRSTGELLLEADRALYEAKDQGRNRVVEAESAQHLLRSLTSLAT